MNLPLLIALAREILYVSKIWAFESKAEVRGVWTNERLLSSGVTLGQVKRGEGLTLVLSFRTPLGVSSFSSRDGILAADP